MTITITIRYLAQLKDLVGSQDRVEIEPGASVRACLRQAAQKHGETLTRLLFAPEGTLRPALLLFVDDEQVDLDRTLSDNAVLTVLTPMAGG